MSKSAGDFSLFFMLCVVSGLFNAIVDNFWLLWETLLSPLFCGYMGTLGVFMIRGMLGGGCPTLSLSFFLKWLIAI